MTDESEERVRRNVTIPRSVDDQLGKEHINASGLISDLLRAYFAIQDPQEAAEYTAGRRSQDREATVEEAVETLSARPDVQGLDHYNDAVLRWASKLEVPPERLVDAVLEFNETGEVPAL